jgi:tuftelin-interacting protein 11
MASWTPSTDPTRIPEVRHNIRLVADACKTDLDGLAREAKALEERKRFIAQENVRLQKKVADEAERMYLSTLELRRLSDRSLHAVISRLQQVTLVVDEINAKSRQLASVYEATLDDFSPLFSRLLVEFPTEFDRYRLDEIVVAAIAPIVRRIVAQWNPLQDPSALVSTFRTWKQALKVNLVEQPPQTQVDVYGTRTIAPPPIIEKPMTPFESLLWNIWLPKVRTSINNEWDPSNSSPAIKLYETWASFLPPFVRDNMLDQLILPKLVKAVSEWNSKRSSVSLRSLVFPWLPHLGLRVEDVLDDARRKIKSTLRIWVATDGLPQDLGVWRDVFDSANWDALLLKYVVPKLASHLRDEFRVNPRAQDMEPLTQVVLPWSSLLRGSIMSQLLETEFFPKWLDVLHIWLIQPRVSFEEVAQWYAFWKSIFGEDVLALRGVQKGFTRGLQLMNEAIELGADAPTKLRRPDIKAEQADDGFPVTCVVSSSHSVLAPFSCVHRPLRFHPHSGYLLPPPSAVPFQLRAPFMPRPALKTMPRSSPFQTFVEVLCEELRKSRENRELQDNVKQLQGDVDKFQDSLVAEAMERAREVYERARVRNFVFDQLKFPAKHQYHS